MHSVVYLVKMVLLLPISVLLISCWFYLPNLQEQEQCYLIGEEKMVIIQSFKLKETKAFNHLIEMGLEVLQYTGMNIISTTDRTTVENIKNILRALQIKFTNTIGGFCTLDHIPRIPLGNYENLVSSSLKVVTGKFSNSLIFFSFLKK